MIETTETIMRRGVAEYLGVGEEGITSESRLSEDLGADSLDALELILLAEREFGIAVGDARASEISTFGDLVAAVEDLKNEELVR